MANSNNNQWEVGIGDPTIFGWITVVSYAASAYLCWKTLTIGAGRDRQAWQLMAIVLIALGINKQLDIQSLMTQEARVFIKWLGLYEMRRTLQVYFLIAISFGALTGLWIFCRKFAALNTDLKVAIGGLCFVVCFVLVRAASFHHLDLLLPQEMLGLSFNFALENVGLVVISVAAVLRKKAIQRHLQTLKKGTWRSRM
jgi:hypothetical protein